MEYQSFSQKQLLALSWWNLPRTRTHDAIICDGSIRSGKTISMTVGFVLWSMARFDRQTFALCGKTIESLRRNVVTPMHRWLEGLFTVTERVAKNYVEISAEGRANRYYLFGGRDESSAGLVQGITLAGVLFDEVALMPRSFVEQALARCSVAGSRFWFNCNPEHPEHWFHKEWIEKAETRGALHLHFTMADNLSLAPEIRARYENLYSGVFYDRFIRGLWRVAEGLVYPMFSKRQIVEPEEAGGKCYVSCDYGTINPFSAGLWQLSGGKAYRIAEYYYDARREGASRTDEEHYAAMRALIGDARVEFIVVDPSAASFIECIRRHGEYRVRKANNTVLDGIRNVSSLLKAGRLFISGSCGDCIREFGMYRWDEAKPQDTVVKEYDHAMDDVRYFANTVLIRELRWEQWGED